MVPHGHSNHQHRPPCPIRSRRAASDAPPARRRRRPAAVVPAVQQCQSSSPLPRQSTGEHCCWAQGCCWLAAPPAPPAAEQQRQLRRAAWHPAAARSLCPSPAPLKATACCGPPTGSWWVVRLGRCCWLAGTCCRWRAQRDRWGGREACWVGVGGWVHGPWPGRPYQNRPPSLPCLHVNPRPRPAAAVVVIRCHAGGQGGGGCAVPRPRQEEQQRWSDRLSSDDRPAGAGGAVAGWSRHSCILLLMLCHATPRPQCHANAMPCQVGHDAMPCLAMPRHAVSAPTPADPAVRPRLLSSCLSCVMPPSRLQFGDLDAVGERLLAAGMYERWPVMVGACSRCRFAVLLPPHRLQHVHMLRPEPHIVGAAGNQGPVAPHVPSSPERAKESTLGVTMVAQAARSLPSGPAGGQQGERCSRVNGGQLPCMHPTGSLPRTAAHRPWAPAWLVHGWWWFVRSALTSRTITSSMHFAAQGLSRRQLHSP